MNQHQFEHTYRQRWDEFTKLLDQLENRSAEQTLTRIPVDELPRRYRQLCNHYGLARARHYSPALVDRLHDLVARGYNQLYKQKSNFFWTLISFVAWDFPRTLRRFQRTFWLAFFLFYAPATAVGLATFYDSSLIYSVMSEEKVFEMESMYSGTGKAKIRGEGRDAETDFSMFGFYIMNNISIGFRTFAGGIIFGAGAVLLLLYNGLFLGGVAGYLSHPPYSHNFWQFVSGHGAFELNAIVICGAAGLMLGYSLVRPGQYRRTDSLKMIAPHALKLVMGAALMLLIAAFIEAFWSSSGLAPTIKYWVAAGAWLLVGCYLIFAGRGRHES